MAAEAGRGRKKGFQFPDELKQSFKPCTCKGASLNSVYLEL